MKKSIFIILAIHWCIVIFVFSKYEFTKKIYKIAGIGTKVKTITSDKYKEIYTISSNRIVCYQKKNFIIE